MENIKNTGSPKIRILLVDDHPLIRGGLRSLIQTEPDMEVCGETDHISQALNLASSTSPDLAIVDLSLATHNDGLSLIKRLKIPMPDLKILVCSIHDETIFAPLALAAGAKGYINKKEPPFNILEAIRQVQKGDYYVSKQLIQRILQNVSDLNLNPIDPLSTLSIRQLEIYRLVGIGLKSSQIAEHLHISVKTVECHKTNIRKKLNLSSASELLRHASAWSTRDA